MEDNQQRVFRCRLCHTLAPMGTQQCPKRGCNALLNIHGEVGVVDEYGNWSKIVNPYAWNAEPPQVIMVDPPPPPPKPVEPPRVKEPKPQKVKKVKEPKPPKERSEKSGNTIIVIFIVILVLVLIAAAVALIWYLKARGGEDNTTTKRKAKTSSSTENPPPPEDPDPDPDYDPIPAPDFLIFMGEDAELISEQDNGNCQVYKYQVSSSNVLDLLDAYYDLLEDHYAFELTDQDNHVTWFRYTGSSPITTLTSSISGTEYHIEVIPYDDNNGVTPIEFHFSREIELEDPSEYMDDPDESLTYDVPDFVSFTNNYATFTAEETRTSYTVYNYDLPQGCKDMLGEYEDLLKSVYSFEHTDEHNVSESDCETFYIFYTHTQAASVPTATVNVDGKSIDFHLSIALQITAKEEIVVALVLANKFEFVEPLYTSSFDTRVVPEFEQWASSDSIEKSSTQDFGDAHTIQFYYIDLDLATWNFTFKEYRDYIASQYDFELIGSGTTESSSGTVYHNLWYSYTGSGTVTTDIDTGSNGEEYEFALCVYWYEASDGTIVLGVIYPEELALVSTLTQCTQI